MKRIARRQIDYRTKEQQENFIDGDRHLGYNSVMPGEEVPEHLVAQLVAGTDALEPLMEEVKEKGKTVKKEVKGHGLTKSQLTKDLDKAGQMTMLLKYGVIGEDLEKLGKGWESKRVEKLLEFK